MNNITFCGSELLRLLTCLQKKAGVLKFNWNHLSQEHKHEIFDSKASNYYVGLELDAIFIKTYE
jgi:hypothetical protein